MMITIDVGELRDKTCELLSRIEKDLGYPSVQIPYDGYWDMSPQHRYKVGMPPTQAAPNLITPKLSNDWHIIQNLNKDPLPNEFPDSVCALENAAPLVRAVGEVICSLLIADPRTTREGKHVTAIPDVAQQVQTAWTMSEEDLYKHLGMADLGTRSVTEAVDSMNMLMTAAANTDSASATMSLGQSLMEKGQRVFVSLWDGLKEVVCTIYKDKTGIGDAKDLVTYLVAAVVAAGTISNPLAVLVITIAVKKGLDTLCAT
jgi:hypothetical protein